MFSDVHNDPMFSDVHNRIHFTLSFPKDTTNHDDTSNTYIPVSNPRVRWNPNKASEYVQVLENDPNNTLNIYLYLYSHHQMT